MNPYVAYVIGNCTEYAEDCDCAFVAIKFKLVFDNHSSLE